MSPRTLIPATAVAALATALASQAEAQPIVRLPDQAPVTLGDLPIRTAPTEAADTRVAPQVVSPVEALVRQAQTWRRQGRNDQAEATLKRALALSPDAPEVLYQLADLSRAKGDAMGAAIWTGKLAAVRPGDPRLGALAKAIPPPAAQAGTLSPFEAPPAPRIEVQAAAALPAPQGQALPPMVKSPAKAAPVAVPAGGQLRADGFQALNSGDLANAERLFGQALKASAQDREAAGGLGVVRLRQQRFAEARDLLARAAQGPNAAGWREAYEAADFFASLRVAADAREAGRLAEAETKARKLAARNLPYAVEADLLLGDTLSAQRKPAEAEAAFRAALAKAPDRAETRQGLALVLIDQGRADEARELAAGLDGPAARGLTARIERIRAAKLAEAGDNFGAGAALANALAAAPDDPWIRYDYARFLAEHGDAAQAASVAAPLSAANAGPDALSAAALYAASRSRLAEAASILRRIPETRRTADVKALARRLSLDGSIQEAKALAAQGLTTRAVILLRGQADAAGADFAARSRLALALYDLGDAYQAGAMARAAAEAPLPTGARPGDGAGFVEVLAASGQDLAAEQLLASLKAQARGGEDQAALTRLMTGYAVRKADQQRTAGDYAGAFDTLSAAFNAAPGDKGLTAALARLCQAGGLKAQAAQVYDALVRMSPSDADVLLEAARAAIDAEDWGRAEQRLALGLKAAPAKAELYFELGRMEKARGHDRAAARAFRTAQSLSHTGAPTGVPGQALAQNPILVGGALGPNPFAGSRAASNPFAPQSLYGPALQPASFPMQASGQGPAIPAYPQAAPSAKRSLAGLLPSFGDAPMTVAADAPLQSRIAAELDDLAEDHAIAVDTGFDIRARSGDAGTSRVTEIETRLGVSAPAFGGRISAEVTPTTLRAGTSGGFTAAGIGTAPLEVAAGKLQTPPVPVVARATSPQVSGVGFKVGFKSEGFSGDVGITPAGFGHTTVVGGLQWTPKLGPAALKLGLERRAVTDSVLSYAGLKDAYTGQTWGGVTKDQVTLGASYDRGNGIGAYGEVAAKRLTGRGVASNTGYEVNLGGYVTVYQGEHGAVKLGANLNAQAYEKNLRHFSLGQGGYFSPQQYVSLSFPVSYTAKGDRWSWDVKLAPGFSAYSEDPSPIFPTDPARQGKITYAAGQSAEVSAVHAGTSRSGFGVSGEVKGEYRIGRSTTLGGHAGLDTFGQYNEFKLGVFLKKTFGGR